MTRKILSIILTLAMALSLGSTLSFAASYQVEVTFGDGTTQTLANTNPIKLSEFTTSVPSSVVLTDAEGDKTVTDFSKTVTTTLKGGTQVQTYTSESAGVKSLYVKYGTIKENFKVKVVETPKSFTVYTNSGAYGKNNNYGGEATAASTAAEKFTADKSNNWTYETKFTPNSGLDLYGINIREGSTDGKGQIIKASELGKTVTIEGVSFSLTGNAKAITVKASGIYKNYYITALTEKETIRYSLTSKSTGNVKPSAASQTIVSGENGSVVYTPSNGYAVGDLTVANAKGTKTLSKNASVTIGNATYKRTDDRAGKVTVSVTKLDADTTITPSELSGYYVVNVKPGEGIDSDKEGANLVDENGLKIKFEPDEYYELNEIIIKTGGRTYSADAYSNRIATGNYSYSITHSGDTVILDLDYITSDMTIETDETSEYVGVDITYDKGITSNSDISKVATGADVYVVFTPKNTYTIEEITIDYGGKSYSITRGTNSVYFDGQNHKILWNSNGSVSVTVYDVEKYLEIDADSDYSASGTYKVTKNVDTYSNITLSGGTTYDSGESCPVKIHADSGHEITYVDITNANDSARVFWGDTSFVFDGRSYSVSYTSSKKYMNFTLKVKRNTTISAYTDYTHQYNEGYYDSNGVFHYYDIQNGYYDNTGVFHYYGTQNGYYDNNGIFHYYDSLSGYYDANGVFHSYSQPNGYYDSNGVYHNNFGTQNGYYDVNGIFHYYTGNFGYYNANGVWVGSAYHSKYIEGYNDGTFRPDVALTRAQAIQMLANIYNAKTTQYKSAYSDVAKDAWYYEAVAFAEKSGYLTTVFGATKTLSPSSVITRSEFTALICLYNNAAVSSPYSGFSDVSPYFYLAPYITYGKNIGWISGYTATTFGPNDPLTRAQAVTIINRATGRVCNHMADYPQFTDVPKSHWAFSEIQEAAISHYAY